uniref:putative inorganic carbon transporter subunit DabA n=1 Tax=Massilia sp. TWR1-2-2 TaxID=2804584 RepID=UPI003CE76FEA
QRYTRKAAHLPEQQDRLLATVCTVYPVLNRIHRWVGRTLTLYDGERWVHEPLRLTVVIDAPQAAIEAVIRKHAVVKQLLENSWLHLWRFEQAGFVRYVHGDWAAVALEGS